MYYYKASCMLANGRFRSLHCLQDQFKERSKRVVALGIQEFCTGWRDSQ